MQLREIELRRRKDGLRILHRNGERLAGQTKASVQLHIKETEAAKSEVEKEVGRLRANGYRTRTGTGSTKPSGPSNRARPRGGDERGSQSDPGASAATGRPCPPEKKCVPMYAWGPSSTWSNSSSDTETAEEWLEAVNPLGTRSFFHFRPFVPIGRFRPMH